MCDILETQEMGSTCVVDLHILYAECDDDAKAERFINLQTKTIDAAGCVDLPNYASRAWIATLTGKGKPEYAFWERGSGETAVVPERLSCGDILARGGADKKGRKDQRFFVVVATSATELVLVWQSTYALALAFAEARRAAAPSAPVVAAVRCYVPTCAAIPQAEPTTAFLAIGAYDEDADTYEEEPFGTLYTCANGHEFFVASRRSK